MKTLKLVFVAVLVSCSLVVLANPTTSKKNVMQAKKELYKDIKKNVIRWDVMNDNQGFFDGEFVVYCKLNKNNQVEIIRVLGEKEELKQRFVKTMHSHPVSADPSLQNELISFRLRFEEH